MFDPLFIILIYLPQIDAGKSYIMFYFLISMNKTIFT